MAEIINTTTNESGDTIYEINPKDNESITLATAGTYIDKNIVFNISEKDLIPNEASVSNQLADKLYVDNKLSVYGTEHTVNIQNMTETTATIAPNTFYIWGEVSELDITLAEPEDSTIYNEYMFQFTSGETATTLSLPDNINWYLNNNIILSEKTYQISIVNNLAVLGEF